MDQNQETSMERACNRRITGLQKSQKMGKQTPSNYLDGLQNVDAKVGHYRRIGTLDRIQDMVL
jgi:hypothetical protein